ncbi:MAG: O-antigen ligase family protein [Desulfobacteraceae bacterium]|nr:MAG: O-antigen ligase family protein [Desulfobacteraceae bacterium]
MNSHPNQFEGIYAWDASTETERESGYATVARVSFFLYLFYFIFFVPLPFQPDFADVEDIGTSNVIKQIVLSILFLASFFTLIPKRKAVVSLIAREKFLTLFLAWCLLSVFWSEFRMVSFKRLFQIFTPVVIGMAVLFHAKDSEEPLKYIRYTLYLYIPISIVSVFIVPEAIDPKSVTWRALEPSKNHLGQAAVLSILFWLTALGSKVGGRKPISLAMLFLSLLLLIGSQSMTAVTTLLILVVPWLIFSFDRRFQALGIGHLFSIIAIFTVAAAAWLILTFAPETFFALVEQMGKDTTFTGRTDLWGDIWEEARKNLLVGTGFSGFWVMDNRAVQYLYLDYPWLPLQAHLGYLDILNETGVVGLSLVLAMVGSYLVRLLKEPNVWQWFFFAALIINLQETTLFRPNILSGDMFLFAYLAMFSDLIRSEGSGGPDRLFHLAAQTERKQKA